MRRALDTDTLAGPPHPHGSRCTMGSTVGPLPPGRGGHTVPHTHRLLVILSNEVLSLCEVSWTVCSCLSDVLRVKVFTAGGRL